MTLVTKIDSNASSLSYAVEDSLGVLPVTPDWVILEPNSYAEFGGNITTVARNPINASRQRKKGVVTDLDASGGFNTDWTQDNLQDLMQGYFYADFRPKGEEVPTAATATTDLFDVAATAGFLVNSLVRSTGWDEAGNNGNDMLVTAVVANTTIEVLGETLVTQASPPAGVNLVVVGHQTASADVNVVVTGAFPVYESQGGVNWTTLGLIPGEWIFVGGDGASEDFVNAENNGWKRIKAITATDLTVDKSDSTMVVETGGGLTIRFYFGRVLKNEATPSLQVRRTYNLERTLGAPDDALPSEIQSEYIIGAVPSTAQLNIPAANKVSWDMTFIGTDSETRTGAVGVKSGNRPALVESDMFNTSSDFSRIRIATYDDTTEAPTPAFTYAEELSLTLNNNLTPNKAVGVLGSFEVTVGTFQVGGSVTAYFENVSAIASVRANDDITLDVVMVKGATGEKQGVAIDVPLITLGEGRPNVEQDQAIKLPLSTEAATGAGIDANMDHTLIMSFFDFLPDAADT